MFGRFRMESERLYLADLKEWVVEEKEVIVEMQCR